MADWKEWLNKGKDWATRTAGAYKSADQQSNDLGNELAAKKQMVDQGRIALAEPIQGAAPAEPAMADYGSGDLVNPGYRPIGGENALRDLYAGHPPALLPSPAAKRPLMK